MSFTLEYIYKLGRVKRVSCTMMEDRGYQIPKNELKLKDESDLTVGAMYLKIAKNLKCSYGYALSSTYVRGDESTLVLFLDNNYDEGKKREKMVSTEQAKSAISMWKTSFNDSSSCILICPGKLSPDAKKEVTISNLTLLTHEFLMMPIAKHIMVPLHEALTDEDARVFLHHRKLDSNQLPQIKITDPVCMYYGFQIGTIVKVSRLGWTVFRIVSS